MEICLQICFMLTDLKCEFNQGTVKKNCMNKSTEKAQCLIFAAKEN